MVTLTSGSLVTTTPADNPAPLSPVTDTPPPAAAGNAAQAEDTLQTLRARLERQVVDDEDSTTAEARIHQDRVLHRLTQVKIAQARLHDGTYGACIDCQEPIEGDRLVALPFALRCTRCQTIAEWRGFSY